MNDVLFKRVWAMPSKDTLTIKPILDLATKWIKGVSIDPFAGNCELALYRNDINPNTKATCHEESIAWLKGFDDNFAESAIVDPPYSPRQMKECYNSVGIDNKGQASTQSARLYNETRQELDRILTPEAFVLWLGWSSVGMTTTLGWKMVDGLIVCHGGGHNDTIATVWERSGLT